MKEIITVKAECPDCGATGLFTPWHCHEGATLICEKCQGAGCVTLSLEYTPFKERKEEDGIERVFRKKPGLWIHLFPAKHTFPNGKTIDFSKWGCTYDEWKNGEQPKEIPDDYDKED